MAKYVYLGSFKTSNSEDAKQILNDALRDYTGHADFEIDQIINKDVHVVINIQIGKYSIAPFDYLKQNEIYPLYE